MVKILIGDLCSKPNVVVGSVSTPAALRLTQLDGQSLPQILPDGWSPAGAATIVTEASPQLPFTLRVRNDFQLASNSAKAQFKLFLPEGPNEPDEGTVRFEVEASEIESGLSLVFFNDTQQTSVSATIQDGKYTAALAGRITDEFFVNLIDAADNETRVDLPLMQYPDGLGAAFKPEGGTFVTAEDIEITIQPDTFDTITPVRLETIQIPEEELPAHDDYVPLQHFILNLNGATAQQEIGIAIPLPPGITEDSQVFVMKPVEFFGRRKWMAMEEMQIVDGMLRTQSPPWPGVEEQAITTGDGYSITAASVPMYFLQGSVEVCRPFWNLAIPIWRFCFLTTSTGFCRCRLMNHTR